MGLPVITTPRNGVREVMGQRGGIVIEEPGNAEALATAIRVLADDELRAFTSERCAVPGPETPRADAARPGAGPLSLVRGPAGRRRAAIESASWPPRVFSLS